MLLVDTNILVYAVNLDSTFHAPCGAWLKRQQHRPGAWYTTWPIVYEFLSVTTHPRILPHPFSASQAWQFVTALLVSPGLSVLVPTDRHADVAGQVIAEFPRLAGSIFHDAHTAILMREHGVRQICTRDTGFLPVPVSRSGRSAADVRPDYS